MIFPRDLKLTTTKKVHFRQNFSRKYTQQTDALKKMISADKLQNLGGRKIWEADLGGRNTVTIATYNMRGYKSNWPTLQSLINMNDITMVQEHWLHDYEGLQKLSCLGDVSMNVACFDTHDKTLPTNRYRGQKGTAITWKNSLVSRGMKIITH